MKIVLFSDLHFNECEIPDDRFWGLGKFDKDGFEKTLAIVNRMRPDAIVNLGDMICDRSKEEDEKDYQTVMGAMRKDLAVPIIHVAGNHDVGKLNTKGLEQLWRNNGYEAQVFGSRVIKGWKFIWLSTDEEDHYKLSDKQLEWLKNVVEEDDLPKIILSHLAIGELNIKGNSYCDGCAEHPFFYTNSQEIIRAIETNNTVKYLFNGHLHWQSVKKMNQNCTVVSVPSFSDNLANHYISPNIFMTAKILKDGMTLKTYSGTSCICSLELA